MADSEPQKAILDRFPGSLESVTWRKSSQDHGVTIAVPHEMREYLNPLRDKMNLWFVFLAVVVTDQAQAEALLKAQADDGMPETFALSGPATSSTDWTCSLDEMAELLMLTVRHTNLLAQRGIVVKVARGRYDIRESVRGYIKEIRNEKHGGNSYNEERVKKIRIQNEKAEIELLARKKKLVNAEEVIKAVAENNLRIRNRVLYLEAKLPPLVAGHKDLNAIRRVVEENVRECLTDLSGLDVSRLGGGRGEQKVHPSPKAKRQPVGRPKKSSKPNKR